MDLLDVRKQNPWWENPIRINEDPKLMELSSVPLRWEPRLGKFSKAIFRIGIGLCFLHWSKSRC